MNLTVAFSGFDPVLAFLLFLTGGLFGRIVARSSDQAPFLLSLVAEWLIVLVFYAVILGFRASEGVAGWEQMLTALVYWLLYTLGVCIGARMTPQTATAASKKALRDIIATRVLIRRAQHTAAASVTNPAEDQDGQR